MSNRSILVVDDNATSRKLLRAILESEKFAVIEAADGIEALDQLKTADVTAVVSDILMPRLDGYRLCNEIRKQPRWSSLPFIMYSATYENADDRQLAIELGADRFLRKPASSKEIVGALLDVMKPTARATHSPLEAPAELAVMKHYSERLVTKLEERSSELADTVRQLQMSEIRYRTLAETANDTIFSVDRDGTMRYINGRGAEFFNLTPEQVIGKKQNELFPSSVANKNIAAFEQVFATGQPLHDENVRPFHGEDRWHATWLVPLRDETAQVVGIMGVARDVTDHKRLEELRAHIRISLSHELNTPINGIVGIGELLRDGIEEMTASERREMVELLLRSAFRLNRLVQLNLDYAQLELIASNPSKSEKLYEHVPTEWQNPVRKCAERVAADNDRGSDLRLNIGGAGSTSIASTYIERVVIELLDNAFKFSAPTTPVDIAVGQYGGEFRIVVKDRGCGMTEEQIGSIDAFRQFDRKLREQQGIGLGLYLTRRIAELYGGHLAIASGSGGTTMTVTLSASATAGRN